MADDSHAGTSSPSKTSFEQASTAICDGTDLQLNPLATPTSQQTSAIGTPDSQHRTITLTVNGDPHRLEVQPHWTLVQVIRTALNLTGTKEHCDEGACGMCTVISDGRPILACMTLAATMDGQSVTTVEGLSNASGKLHPIQAAWVEEQGAQCGYCTPGFIMATKALLDRTPEPTTLEIKEALGGNICRCGNYEFIINSVHTAANLIAGKPA